MLSCSLPTATGSARLLPAALRFSIWRASRLSMSSGRTLSMLAQNRESPSACPSPGRLMVRRFSAASQTTLFVSGPSHHKSLQGHVLWCMFRRSWADAGQGMRSYVFCHQHFFPIKSFFYLSWLSCCFGKQTMIIIIKVDHEHCSFCVIYFVFQSSLRAYVSISNQRLVQESILPQAKLP